MHAAVVRSLFETRLSIGRCRRAMRKLRIMMRHLVYADTLLKTSQRTAGYVMPSLEGLPKTRCSGEFRKLPRVESSLERGVFLQLSGGISDARTPLRNLSRSQGYGSAADTAELRSYLYFLVDRKFYDLAYYTWLQFMPAEQLNKVGNLFNGSFEIVPSGLPFDWAWTDKSGAMIQMCVRPDQKGSMDLNIELGPGRVDFPGFTQLIMLSPGNYHFQGGYKSALVGQRGLEWRITCAGGEGGALGASRWWRAGLVVARF